MTASRALLMQKLTRISAASFRRLRHPNVTLLTDTKVTRLETDASGREVTAVEVERNGTKENYSGRSRRRVRRRDQFRSVLVAFG